MLTDDELLRFDEFALLPENATAAGVSSPLPPVGRIELGTVSALTWGEGPAEVVFLHGGGQNAHTWDTVVLGLGLPALAVDLPGHGRSAWREDGDYGPKLNAETLRPVLRELAPSPRLVVGMSLGGLTLGIGMLVDNSIVILENIYKYREKGAKLKVSAILGSQEMIMAIMASTLTTICVFAPMVMFKNQLDMIGEMFSGLAFTVVIVGGARTPCWRPPWRPPRAQYRLRARRCPPTFWQYRPPFAWRSRRALPRAPARH